METMQRKAMSDEDLLDALKAKDVEWLCTWCSGLELATAMETRSIDEKAA